MDARQFRTKIGLKPYGLRKPLILSSLGGIDGDGVDTGLNYTTELRKNIVQNFLAG